MTYHIEDQEWQAQVACLRQWMSDKGTVVADRWDPVSFGNRLHEVDVEGVHIRLTRDRGDFAIDVGTDGTWHAVRNVLGFANGQPPSQVASADDPSLGVMFSNWSLLAEALRHPALSTYESQVGDAVLNRLGAADIRPSPTLARA